MKEVFFDIDGTLINSKLLARLVHEEIIIKIGMAEDEIIKIEDDYKSQLVSHTDFHPDDLMKYLIEKTGKETNDLKNVFDNKEFYLKSLYSETKEVLNKLSKICTLGIFSEGFEDYQSKKLGLGGIKKFFNKELIFIGRRKLNDNFIEKLPDNSIIIDDDRGVIEKLKTVGRFNLFWINRKDDQIMGGVKTVKNLDEFFNLVTLED